MRKNKDKTTNHAVNVHTRIAKVSKRIWKHDIRQKKYPICFFCGKPITKFARNFSNDPEVLTMEFNANGQSFAEFYRSGNIQKHNTTTKDLLPFCFPAHLDCNTKANQQKTCNTKTKTI